MTAKRSRQTKMPLSNLLLVFCPTLNMSPPLLKVLCENEYIWEAADEEEENIEADTTLTAEHLPDTESHEDEQELDTDDVEIENEYDSTSFSNAEQDSISGRYREGWRDNHPNFQALVILVLFREIPLKIKISMSNISLISLFRLYSNTCRHDRFNSRFKRSLISDLTEILIVMVLGNILND